VTGTADHGCAAGVRNGHRGIELPYFGGRSPVGECSSMLLTTGEHPLLNGIAGLDLGLANGWKRRGADDREFSAADPRKCHAALPADEEEVAPLEEFERDVGERLQPLCADRATRVTEEYKVAIGPQRAMVIAGIGPASSGRPSDAASATEPMCAWGLSTSIEGARRRTRRRGALRTR
jgi:hypothetical protein